MPRPVVLATRHFPDAVERRLATLFEARLNPQDAVWDAAEIARRAQGAVGLMIAAGQRLDEAAIAMLPDSIRIIATFSVGYEHLDVAAAARRGIVCSNTPDVLTDATAEMALLCLLGAARRAWEGQSMLRAGQWHGWAPTQLLGIGLTGKRLGIVGMGRIGQAMARRARACGMEIHYTNRQRLAPALEDGAIFHATVQELLPLSQFLSLHCPLTPQTARLINRDSIAALPDGAVIVNTARGGIVDDEALIAALKSGKVAAAGLDVFEGEPRLDPRYLPLPNTYLLPHMGSASTEARNAMGFCCIDNLQAVLLDGKPAPTRIAV
jgi:lactate dehydrogenase-like 2-hydroxyacid dehydrogenase